jgi:hypothetical protein
MIGVKPMAFCEWREHEVEQVKNVVVHNDGVNPVETANYCDRCINEQQNDFLASANDIYMNEEEFFARG